MNGPYKNGTFEFPGPPSNRESTMNLIAGQKCRVVKGFVDADGDQHKIGAEWVFVCTMFDRQSDTLTLCIRKDDGTEWQIPLSWKSPAQDAVIENLKSFITHVGQQKGG